MNSGEPPAAMRDFGLGGGYKASRNRPTGCPGWQFGTSVWMIIVMRVKTARPGAPAGISGLADGNVGACIARPAEGGSEFASGSGEFVTSDCRATIGRPYIP